MAHLSYRRNKQANNLPMIVTGNGSASRYATLAMENTLTLYTDSLDALLRDLSATPTQRFPNLILRQTEEPTVYFDPRPDQDGFPWASPISAYLAGRRTGSGRYRY